MQIIVDDASHDQPANEMAVEKHRCHSKVVIVIHHLNATM